MTASTRLLFDENFGRPFVHELGVAARTRTESIELKHLFELFPSGADDAKWIPAIATEGFVVVSADRARRYGGAKLPQVCRALNVTHVLVGKSVHHLPNFEKLEAFLAVWSALLTAGRAAHGTRFSLRRTSPRRVILVEVAPPR